MICIHIHGHRYFSRSNKILFSYMIKVIKSNLIFVRGYSVGNILFYRYRRISNIIRTQVTFTVSCIIIFGLNPIAWSRVFPGYPSDFRFARNASCRVDCNIVLDNLSSREIVALNTDTAGDHHIVNISADRSINKCVLSI